MADLNRHIQKYHNDYSKLNEINESLKSKNITKLPPNIREQFKETKRLMEALEKSIKSNERLIDKIERKGKITRQMRVSLDINDSGMRSLDREISLVLKFFSFDQTRQEINRVLRNQKLDG